MLSLPPLSLYVHLPWCVRKCPYCDFNSHAFSGDIPAQAYIQALLSDLQNDLPHVWGRPVHSVFFGGGTPSLFSANQIEQLLQGIRSLLPLTPAAEITLEANPGTIEHDSFTAYREAGVNRVSLGVQSFDDDLLASIGRIHGGQEARDAVESIHRSGLQKFNIDLMFGLPGQTVQQAISDVQQAIELGASHVSHYQLTLEPNTEFHARPPRLPADERCWEMQEACARQLTNAGHQQYEISAWARPGHRCQHNLNYWRYGDYLGIGAGAHGKLTLPAEGEIRRLAKKRHPRAYLQAQAEGSWQAESRLIEGSERSFEFFLIQLRLHDGVYPSDFEPRTGLQWSSVSAPLAEAQSKGLLECVEKRWRPTALGWRFINDIQAMFLPAESVD